MPIYDQTFRHYEGPRHLKALWWPVTVFTFKPVFKRKLVWLILAGFVLFLAYISIAFFIVAKMQEFVPDRQSREAARAVRRQGMRFFSAEVPLGTIFYSIMQPLTGMLWLLVLIAGSGCISSDRRNNALPLYFSRPLRPWDYAAGKILGVALLPLAAMLLTQWLIGIQYIAWYLPVSGFFTELPSFAAGAVYAVLLCGFVSLAMVSISSMAKSNRVAGVGFLVFFVLMQRLGPVLARATGSDFFRALSPLHSIDVIGRALLKPNFREISSSVDTGALQTPLAAMVCLGYIALFLVVLRRNLRVVEVVK